MVRKTSRLYRPYTDAVRLRFRANRPSSSVFSPNDAAASCRRFALSRAQVESRLRSFPEGAGGKGMLWSLAGCGVSYIPLELPRIGFGSLLWPGRQLVAE